MFSSILQDFAPRLSVIRPVPDRHQLCAVLTYTEHEGGFHVMGACPIDSIHRAKLLRRLLLDCSIPKALEIDSIHFLVGGGFKYFLCSPRSLGK